MVKRKWSEPGMTGLGLQNTKECIETIDDKGLIIHVCQYCGKIFKNHSDEVAHEKDCYKNPAHKPVNPMPDGNEGDWIVPVS